MSKRTGFILDFVASATPDRISANAMTEAKRALLDALGCGMAGHFTDKGITSVEAAAALHGEGRHKVLNSAKRLNMAGAAFANAELIHSMDYCALTDPPAHATPFIIPPLMALAETHNSSGADFIAAVALAHELAYRLGLAISAPIRSDNGGMIGGGAGFSMCVAATALAGARMIGLDRQATNNALGIAAFLSPVAGTMRFIQMRTGHVAMTKMAPAGWFGAAGVTAVMWAKAGYTGDREIFDGEPNFGKLLGRPEWRPERFTDGLGENWIIDQGMVYKQFPCGMPGHPLLECVVDTMREQNLTADDVTEIVINATATHPIFDNRKVESQTEVQFSVPYMVALVALGIEPGAPWFDKSLMTDPRVLAFMDKIRIRFNENANDAVIAGDRRRRWSASVDVVAKGKTFKAERLVAKGDPSKPETRTTDATLVDKFIANLAQCGRDDGAALADAIWDLDTAGDIHGLMTRL